MNTYRIVAIVLAIVINDWAKHCFSASATAGVN